ncbi:hypothetical protein Tco_1382098 [Tanacetum coccineum]
MGNKHLDTQKGSLESSVKDPIPIPRESDVISDGDCDDDYQKRFDLKDEHLDTIPVTELANTIKSSVDDLVPTPSESADLYDGESYDDESLSEEEIQKDEFKYFSNPLYDLDDEIITNEKFLPNQKDLDVVIPIPPGIDERCFNAESDLLESLQNREIPCNTPKLGRSGIRVRGVLLQDQ